MKGMILSSATWQLSSLEGFPFTMLRLSTLTGQLVIVDMYYCTALSHCDRDQMWNASY